MAEPANNGYTRDLAWQLLTEWTQSESLRKHAIAVEICVTACGEAEADRLGLIRPRARGDDRALLDHRALARLRLRAPSIAR